MATDEDELETNPFYKSLQTHFLDLFETAQSKCHWICVPQSTSLSPILRIGRDFAETHVLRPSPLFRSHFESLNPVGLIKDVMLSDEGDILTVRSYIESGNHVRQDDVRILSEELAYNKNDKQYKILILEKPLHPKYQIGGILASDQVKENLEKEKTLKVLHTHKVSVQECTDFLNSFDSFSKVMNQLAKNIDYFLLHYMVLKDYLDDVSRRLEDISISAQKSMLKKMDVSMRQDLRFLDVLAGAVESFVLDKVYSKVFPVIRERMKKDDGFLHTKYVKLSKIKPEQIGVPKNFSCPLPAAVVQLSKLGCYQTPREKLYCLKATVDSVTDGITSFIQETESRGLVGITSDEGPCITSDDLIPILVIIIAQARCTHLASDLCYIEQFMWYSVDKDRDDLSYCLVTFKAAMQYTLATSFSYLKETKNPGEKETSIEELLVTKRREDMAVRASATSAPVSSGSQSGRMERQLSRITGVLEKTRLQMGGPTDTGQKKQIKSIFPGRTTKPLSRNESSSNDIPPGRTTKPSSRNGSSSDASPLGDFLSSLQSDNFDQAFGKQF